LSFDPEIGSLRARISRAIAERDAGQSCGSPQRYIAACQELQVLEAALERVREQRVRSAASGGRFS
jgi:hypothetical protein